MTHNPSLTIEPDEHILIIVREAKIILVAKLLAWAAIAAIPFVVDAALSTAPLSISEEWLSLWALVKGLYLLFALLGLLIIITLYYLNVHVVTNKRIIDSDQISITRHHVTETHISRVQDVAAEIQGLFGHIFNYGTVAIQSAGDIAKINFENVPDPKKIKRLILDTHYPHIPKPAPPSP